MGVWRGADLRDRGGGEAETDRERKPEGAEPVHERAI
jgi:hypothetical protein